MISIVSPDSIASDTVLSETRIALGKNIPIQPFIVRNVNILPDEFSNLLIIDAVEQGYDSGLQQLIKYIENLFETTHELDISKRLEERGFSKEFAQQFERLSSPNIGRPSADIIVIFLEKNIPTRQLPILEKAINDIFLSIILTDPLLRNSFVTNPDFPDQVLERQILSVRSVSHPSSPSEKFYR